MLNPKLPVIECAEHSQLKAFINEEGILEHLELELTSDELAYITKKQKRKIEIKEHELKLQQSKTLEEHFDIEEEGKAERNRAIINAIDDGYTQAGIAKYLNISTSAISKIVKKWNAEKWLFITWPVFAYLQVILQPHGIAFEMQAHLKSASHTSGIVIFTLLRICRETLTNIIKHADATRVDMALEVDAKTVRLQIGDNGSGFDLHDHGKGHGLRSMRKRAELLEGSFAIDSAKGTTVVLSLPVDGTLQGDDG